MMSLFELAAQAELRLAERDAKGCWLLPKGKAAILTGLLLRGPKASSGRWCCLRADNFVKRTSSLA